ncbi:MAG TPA: DUF559 domain-containing protein [Roseiarcus sp.]|nr:DUF559 domain-containing protein [Roseiarcus sp.]
MRSMVEGAPASQDKTQPPAAPPPRYARSPSPVSLRSTGEERARSADKESSVPEKLASERRDFARALRKHSTSAEDLLWRHLRGSRLNGAKFRRQVPFDRFVVDFYCHAAKLVVEIDGVQHDWHAEYDAERTQILERLGLRIIRFTNAELRNDLESVLARISAELGLASA